MLKPLIRTLNGWRFELPLALVLGASVAFAMIAMPYSIFGGLPAVVAFDMEGPAQAVAAALAGLLSGYAAFRAMKHPWNRMVDAPVATDDFEADEAAMPPVDVAMRLRRADAHPDFPPRAPIRASRDLGEPFMDIVGFADGPNAAGGVASHHDMIPEADFAEVADEPVSAEPVAEEPETPVAEAPVAEAAESVTEESIAHEWPLPAAVEAVNPEVVTPEAATPEAEAEAEPAPVEDAPVAEEPEAFPTIAAFTPEPEIAPAPKPERARRETLAEMMERLSAGLERRAGKPVAPPPADMLAEVLARPRAATPELRDALDELNRLAGRRG